MGSALLTELMEVAWSMVQEEAQVEAAGARDPRVKNQAWKQCAQIFQCDRAVSRVVYGATYMWHDGSVENSVAAGRNNGLCLHYHKEVEQQQPVKSGSS